MALRAWDPFTVLARLDDDFDQLVRRTWGGGPAGQTAGYVPAVEMVADGADVVINLELPGVDIDKDVELQVHEGRLTISGQRHEEQTEEKAGRMLVRELRYGSFRREFALPPEVTADDIEASYDRGMLRVRVRNVTKPPQEPQRIQVKRADTGAPAKRAIDGETA